MIKILARELWAFDAEWVPDPLTGRRVYGLGNEVGDEEVTQHMWKAGGATEQDPTPFLKTVLCRVVSVSVVIRKMDKDGKVSLVLRSIPPVGSEKVDEKTLLNTFLGAIGKSKPQLVGFNSNSADIPILIQRALVNGVTSPEFCKRPNKPWEGIDYFTRGSDYSIDLKEEIAGWGKGTPSLHEIAAACGIPGKLDTTGDNVVSLWKEGKINKIVQYNECDALTTYLVWLRLAFLAGLIGEEGHSKEQQDLETYIKGLCQNPGREHLGIYLENWKRLRA